ncbi:DNA maturase B, partial [bacterium]|nr:DNA maturase B [bacterium]
MTKVPEQLKDFRNFTYLVWQHLGLPEPTPIQYDIAHYLQDSPKRCIIEAFRGVGKSYITAAYVVHQLLLDPQLKFMVVSASKARADDFSTFTQRII